MVNKNLKTIIENKKPFELVQEIDNKYQIPSFEEFMKTYKHDDNLNYADLNSGDIGVEKGYGPCTSSYCSCSSYELRRQLKQKQEDLDNFWEKLKEYDKKWEEYKSSVQRQESGSEEREFLRTAGDVATSIIPLPGLGLAWGKFSGDVNRTIDETYQGNRKYIYKQICSKYNEIKDWYYRIRNR